MNDLIYLWYCSLKYPYRLNIYKEGVGEYVMTLFDWEKEEDIDARFDSLEWVVKFCNEVIEGIK